MDHTGVLIDTSIVIEYLRKNQKDKTRLYTLYKSYKTVFVSFMEQQQLLIVSPLATLNIEHFKRLSNLQLIP